MILKMISIFLSSKNKCFFNVINRVFYTVAVMKVMFWLSNESLQGKAGVKKGDFTELTQGWLWKHFPHPCSNGMAHFF